MSGTRLAAVFTALCVLHAFAMESARAQARSMEQEWRSEELVTNLDLRQVRQNQPNLYDQILKDVNTNPAARDPTSVDDLATASPALEDLNRSSPEALLGLFLLLKSAGKKEPQNTR